jgi:uncharacterized delta-60 repeat protein
MKKFGLILASALICSLSFQVLAQPAAVDATFNVADTGDKLGFGPIFGDVRSTLPLSDGKFIVGGPFIGYNNTAVGRIARLNSDGTIDPTFNAGGAGFNGYIEKLILQADGKIVAVGGFTEYNGTVRNRIARLNADGSLDASFDPGTGVSGIDFIDDVAFQSGKIIIAGGILTYNGSTVKNILRINDNGTLDATFTTGTSTEAIYTLAVQADGKVLIGGGFNSSNGVTRYRIARLSANGAFDATFDAGTTAQNEGIYAIHVLSDGDILIGGTYSQTTYKGIVRLNSNGSVDSGFSVSSGPLRKDGGGYITFIGQQPDGKILVGGDFNQFNGNVANGLARLNTNGTADNTLVTGDGANDQVNDIDVLASGKLIVSGWFLSFNNGSARRLVMLNASGSVDNTFNPLLGTGANSNVYAVKNLTSGKKIIAGAFTAFNTAPVGRIARLNEDGSRDATFNASGVNNTIFCLAVQADGKIIIGGEFTTVAGTPKSSLARLNADGSLDASFNAGLGANSWIYTVALQSDGKVLAAGYIGSQVKSYDIVRYNADGTLDQTFDANDQLAVNDNINKITIMPNGSILIGGYFTSVAGSTQKGVARLTSSGILDPAFNVGTGPVGAVGLAVINDLVAMTDGKILACGYFATFNGSSKGGIVRLNANGSLDPEFTVNIPGTIRSVKVLPDGKLLVTGYFQTVNAAPRFSVTVLNADGTILSSFDAGVVDDGIISVDMQSDGKFVIGGTFSSMGGIKRNSIARLNGFPIIVAEPTASPTNLAFTNITSTSFTYSFTAASPAPDGYVHIRKEGSAPTESPADGTVYTAGQALGSSLVVASGPGTSLSQSSLTPEATYHYAIYAFNGSGSSINYRLTSPATGSAKATNLATEPTTQPTALTFSNITTTSFTASFTASSPAPAGYLAMAAADTPPAPVDGTVYVAGQTLGLGTVSFVGTATTGNVTGLTKSTTLKYAIYAYNGSGSSINYLTTLPLTGTVTTLAEDCTKPSKPTITASGVNTVSLTLTSSAATGNQWFKDNVAITGATTSTLTVTEIGLYSVQVTVTGGCKSDMSTNYAVVITDVSVQRLTEFSFFPNPADNNVTFNLPMAGKKSLKFINSNGVVLQVHATSDNSIEVDLTGYQGGLYYFLLNTDKGLHSGKLLKR